MSFFDISYRGYSLRTLALLCLLWSLVYGELDPLESTCYSYGIDFVHGGKYFINNLSKESFTCVSEFEGTI
jgi:hypothetical protein